MMAVVVTGSVIAKWCAETAVEAAVVVSSVVSVISSAMASMLAAKMVATEVGVFALAEMALSGGASVSVAWSVSVDD